jgi:integrase
MKLTQAKIRAAKPAPQTTGNRRHARYGDGRGLWLIVDPNGNKSWAFLYTINKRRRQMGLGSIQFMNLDQARDEALRLRKLVKRGIDPLAQQEAERAANQASPPGLAKAVPTFESLAEEVIAIRTAKMKNEKAKAQWKSTLETYAFPHIGAMPVDRITAADCKALLLEIWEEKNETASRLRQRINSVLEEAADREYIEEATFQKIKRTIGKLKKRGREEVEHHKALPIEEAAAFAAKLREKDSLSAKALHFLILTAARSGQVRGATWDEIDLEAGLWTVPKERMKKRHSDHVVPLHNAAIALLRSLHKEEGSNLVFPSPTKPGSQMSDNTLNKLMSDMGETEAVPHGFRSTFATWARKEGYDSLWIEAALHHKDENEVRAAYQRTEGYAEERTGMMKHWAAFLEGGSAAA